MSTLTPGKTFRLIVCDDHESQVAAMERRMHKEDVEILHATSAAGALSLALAERPDVVGMDFNGVGPVWPAVARITSAGIPVLIVTGGRLEPFAERALEHGASGIASKSSNSIEIAAALRVVAAGGEHWDEPWGTLVRQLRYRGEAPKPLDRDDLLLIETMRTDTSRQGIANRLAWPLRTVERRVSGLKQRFDIQSDGALIDRLGKAGWLDMSPLES